MRDSPLQLVIIGGGLAGCVAALAMAKCRPDVSILVVEQGTSFGGNHVWSFFDTDVEPQHRHLAELLEPRYWPAHEVRFPARRRTIDIGYNSVISTRLDQIMKANLRPDQYRLGRRVRNLTARDVTLDDGERLQADGVIDARGGKPMPGIDLAWQKFVGRTYRTREPHGHDRPIIMDATVCQQDGYRFAYWLPFSDRTLMVEDTYYSTSPALDQDELGNRLDGLAAAVGRRSGGADAISEEHGVLPVVLGGDFDSLWPEDTEVARLGLRGGFFHPTTGYSLPDAIRNAAFLVTLAQFDGIYLHEQFRARSAKLWRQRHFFQLLNRMLFHAAEPPLRYRVLEHFYRLPESLIGRFYAAQLTSLDKARILSGRPPVPIGRAIRALRMRAA